MSDNLDLTPQLTLTPETETAAAAAPAAPSLTLTADVNAEAEAASKALDEQKKRDENAVKLDDVEMDGDALKDAEAVLKPIKEAHAGLFGKTEPSGTPPINPPGGTKKDPKEMNFNEYKEWRKANP